MNKTEELKLDIAKLFFTRNHPGFMWEHTAGNQGGNYYWDMERQQCIIWANATLEVFKKAGGVFVVEEELPETPDFLYDLPHHRGFLRRGAINYSKMLTGYRKVKEIKL